MTTGLRDIKAAAEWLGIPWTTLRDLVTAGRVPHTRVGRHVRFAQHHLDAIVAAGERKVATAPSRLQVVAIRAAQTRPPSNTPKTNPPPAAPRTPPPPAGPKKADGQQRESSAA